MPPYPQMARNPQNAHLFMFLTIFKLCSYQVESKCLPFVTGACQLMGINKQMTGERIVFPYSRYGPPKKAINT